MPAFRRRAGSGPDALDRGRVHRASLARLLLEAIDALAPLASRRRLSLRWGTAGRRRTTELHLTDREAREVLALVAEGRTNRQIAEIVVHQRQDRERPRLQHPRQARRRGSRCSQRRPRPRRLGLDDRSWRTATLPASNGEGANDDTANHDRRWRELPLGAPAALRLRQHAGVAGRASCSTTSTRRSCRAWSSSVSSSRSGATSRCRSRRRPTAGARRRRLRHRVPLGRRLREHGARSRDPRAPRHAPTDRRHGRARAA